MEWKEQPRGPLPYRESHTADALRCGPHMRASLGFPQPHVAHHHQATGINLGSVLDFPQPSHSLLCRCSRRKSWGSTGSLSPSHTPHLTHQHLLLALSSVSTQDQTTSHLPGYYPGPSTIFSYLGHCHGLLTDLPDSAFTPLQSVLYTAAERSFLNVSLMLPLF